MSKLKTILFLGGNGFLGKNIIANYPLNLIEGKDVRFIVASRFLSGQPEDTPLVSYRKLDLIDVHSINNLFDEVSIDEVFHFASATIPANSNSSINHDIEVNLKGTISVLENMARKGISKITYLSSGGAIYGDTLTNASQEVDFNNPNNSYGIIKLAIEKYITLFYKLHNINYLILRLSNPFGPFHDSDKNGLINISIRKALQKESVTIWGDGKNSKDYIYVKDFALIFWELHQLKVQNKILNIGSGQVLSIIDVLNEIKKIAPDLNWVFEPAKSFDTKKVSFRLDSLYEIFHPSYTSFSKALKETYDWELEKKLNQPEYTRI